jgi:GNAT superfamily N-acetyltransferase
MSVTSGSLRIGIYEPADSDEALDLEARSPQGRAFRLRFERAYFHRRAENFDTWRMVTARREGELVGIAGGALKPALRDGRSTTAAYVFDVRVAPEERRGRIAQRLIQELALWARQTAEFSYGFLAGDNVASSRLATEIFGTGTAPACRYLVYPILRGTRAAGEAKEAPAPDIHQRFLNNRGPFDLYCDPHLAFAAEGYVGSWIASQDGGTASCSAWSNEKTMAEIVDRVPPSLTAAGTLLRHWPLKLLPLPPIPQPGDRVRSWYLFDFDASDGASAARLMKSVAVAARSRGIDYCYIIHRGDEPWIEDLRRRVPRLFAPIVPYSIISQMLDDGSPIFFKSPYIDIRDV